MWSFFAHPKAPNVNATAIRKSSRNFVPFLLVTIHPGIAPVIVAMTVPTGRAFLPAFAPCAPTLKGWRCIDPEHQRFGFSRIRPPMLRSLLSK